MTDRSRLSHEFLLECFEYRDGELFWKTRPTHHFKDEWRQKIFNSRQSGQKAGTLVSGYYMVNFSGARIAVHRIIYFMFNGTLPEEVDHIDGNPLNNRIENLRASTHSQNLRNMKTPSTNTTGVKGVSFHKQTSKYAAGIRENGKWKFLGLFGSIDEAAAVRKKAEQTHYGEFSNGR